jgi:uncharacterized protein (TIGR03437 family)
MRTRSNSRKWGMSLQGRWRQALGTARLVLSLPSLFLVCSVLWGQSGSYLITTVAGGGSAGLGDGGPATLAQLNSPESVAVDASGNLYIADSGDHRIRRVAPGGVITTVAGSGVAGFSGDGGLATLARLKNPGSIAIDAVGNLYIADTGNNRIRKVFPGGSIGTVAGDGRAGSAGDGGPATSASLQSPRVVAVDGAGNLYIAEIFVVRKVTPAGVISTAATGLSITGLAVDAAGNLYVADTAASGGKRIRRITPSGNVRTIGYWGGSEELRGVAVDGSENVYVSIRTPVPPFSDRLSGQVVQLTPAGVVSTLAGTGVAGYSGDGGPSTSAMLKQTAGVALDAAGNVYVADSGNGRIRKLVLSGASAGCIYSIDQDSGRFEVTGGNGSVALLTNKTTCLWFAVSNVGWITITSDATGTGNGLVSYSVAPNGTATTRTATLWIAGKAFTINQRGVVCSLTVSPRSVTVPGGGAIGSVVNITASGSDCGWTASSNVGWLLITSGQKGTGSGTVIYTVGISTGGLRTGTMTIAGRTFYVNQLGAGDSPSSLASVDAGGTVNAANYQEPIAPGSFVSIYGQSFTDGSATWESAIPDGKTLPKSLRGIRVLINAKDCFVSFGSPTQINVLTPPDTATGPVDVDVITANGAATATAVMAPISPALFAYTLHGKLYPVALFANTDVFVAAEGAMPGRSSRPAKPGDYISLFANGLGATDPPYPPGQVLFSVYPVRDLSKLRVSIGGVPTRVLFAGMTFAGLFQVNIQVPDGIAAGDLPVVLQMDGQSTQPDALLTFGG